MLFTILTVQTSRNKYNKDKPELYVEELIKTLWKDINKTEIDDKVSDNLPPTLYYHLSQDSNRKASVTRHKSSAWLGSGLCLSPLMRGHLDVVCSSSLLPPLSDKRTDKDLLESEGAAGSRGSWQYLSASSAPPGGKNGRERIEKPRWKDKVECMKGKFSGGRKARGVRAFVMVNNRRRWGF